MEQIFFIIISAINLFVVGRFLLEELGTKNYQKSFDKTFKVITDGFINNTINDKRDLYLLYKSANSKSFLFTVSFVYFLESYLSFLRNNSTGISSDCFNTINDRIKNYIDEEERDALFENVPEDARKELLALRDSLPAKSKKQVYWLAEVLIDKEKKIKRLSRLTIPLAFIGIALTVYFGIMTLKG